MIALDTNVLVRYLVRDDIEQADTARALMESLTEETVPAISVVRLPLNSSGYWNALTDIPVTKSRRYWKSWS